MLVLKLSVKDKPITKEEKIMGYDENWDVEVTGRKGNGYLRKKKDSDDYTKDKKRSKRLTAYGKNTRAKNNELIHNYMAGKVDEYDENFN